MKSGIFLSLAVSLLLIASCTVTEKADVVIKNGKVVTIDKDNPRAEAVAIVGDRIIAVGSNSKIEKYIDAENTKVIDAEGQLVIPGFNDAHAHYGPVNPDYIELRYITDPSIITQKVKEQVAKVQPGELIFGGHWEHEMFTDKQWPTRELLDEVAPDNPVALRRTDGHSVLVNSYVIKNSGITKDTPDPFGGEIQKDPLTGEPTGIFKEAAQRMLDYGAVQVELTDEEKAQKDELGYSLALQNARELGITSIQIPGSSDWDKWIAFLEEGKLTCRLDIGGVLTKDEERLIDYKAKQDEYPPEGNLLRFGYLKGFIDGTLGSGTALMFEPFSDEPDKSGLPQMTYEELEGQGCSF